MARQSFSRWIVFPIVFVIDKNSLFCEWVMQKCELCIGFSNSPTYGGSNKAKRLNSK